MPEIPKPSGETLNALGAPVTSVLVSTDNDPEVQPYNISFARYNKKECQIDGMDGDNGLAALKILRDVGLYFTSHEDFLRRGGSIEIKNVIDDGEYSSLYKNCREEEIKEIKLVKEQKGVDLRLFYFAIESSKMFYVVATRHTHYDTTKSHFRKIKVPFKKFARGK